MQKYNLRLSDEEYKDLKKASVQIELSVNELIREAIRDWLVPMSPCSKQRTISTSAAILVLMASAY